MSLQLAVILIPYSLLLKIFCNAQVCIEKHQKLATSIVNNIRNSLKQLSFLWEEIEKLYKGQRKVLIAIVITRQGTQYFLVKSLDDCKEALRSFAYRDDIEFSLSSVLLGIEFWAAITQLIELLELIHELQKMLEGNKATISYVYLRWIKLKAHLKRIANSNNYFALDVKAYLETVPVNGVPLTKLKKKNQTRCCQKQLLPIHRVAYYLHPSNSKASIKDNDLKEVEKFFERYILDYKLAFEHFFDFRNHEGNFSNTAIAQGYSDRPKMFWSCQEMFSPALASFAKRLLTTIGNSVPSERVFSAMNYIHSKTRNRLSPQRANKLQYIYMNSRTLVKQNSLEPTTEQLLALEELCRGFQGLE